MTPSPSPSPLGEASNLVDWLMVIVSAVGVGVSILSVAIAMLGVAATTSVAILAWRTSQQATRIAESAHRTDQDRVARANRLELHRQIVEVVQESLGKPLKRLPLDRAESFANAHDVPQGGEIVAWLQSHWAKSAGVFDVPIRLLTWESAEQRFEAWLRGGQFDISEYDAGV